jgi:hypothetical protein
VKPASSKGKSIDDIHLTEDELGLYLDLAPFLNPSPYIVPEDMSMAKVDHALLHFIHSFHEDGYVIVFASMILRCTISSGSLD